MTVLVDSDILIELTRARDMELLRRWEEVGQSTAAVLYSAVSAAELWHGALPGEHKLLNNLFDSLVCVPIDYAIGRRAGELLNKYRKSHGVDLADALIAASAILNRAELWTRNRKHYPMAGISFF